MEILRFLLNFFFNEYGNGKLKPIFSLLEENSFDIKRTLANLKPEDIAPVFKEFIHGVGKNPPAEAAGGQSYGLNPISGIADKDMVDALNRVLCGGLAE